MSASWTQAEEAHLIAHPQADMQQLADDLGRTLHSVSYKRRLLVRAGRVAPRKYFRCDQWTEAEQRYLIENHKMNLWVLSEKFNRTQGAIQSQIQRLRDRGTNISRFDDVRWTPDREAWFIENINRPWVELAKLTDRTVNALRQRYRILHAQGRVPRRKTGVSQYQWLQNKRLQRLVKENIPALSYSELADKIGCSRNQLAGGINRMRQRGLLCAPIKMKRSTVAYVRPRNLAAVKQGASTASRQHSAGLRGA